jgi:hypothetical protein
MFHGAAYNAGRGASFGPTLSRDPRANLVIVAGTGDLDNLTDAAAHRVVSLTERRTILTGTANEIGDVPDPAQGDLESPVINWELELRPGESVTGQTVVFEDVLYFGTFESPTSASGDACQVGTSRIYAGHVRESDPAQTSVKVPRPMLFDEGDPANSSDDTYVLSEVIDSTGSSLVLGLTVDREPVCTQALSVPNAVSGLNNMVPTGASGGGAFQLHALVGGNTSAAHGSQQIGGSQLHEFKRTIQVVTRVSSVGFAGAVE